MKVVFSSIIPSIFFLLLLAICSDAQTAEKNAGIKLFEQGDIAGSIELLKKSDDLVDLNYLGFAYEKSGNEKEARNAFDRSFKAGYKEFADEIIKRSSFEPKQAVPDDKLSSYLGKNAARIVFTAVSARKALDLKGSSTKQNEWIMKARMIGEIGRILVSNQLVYSAREIDIEAKITNKPRPGYTDQARSNNTQGTIELIVFFDADGKVKGAIPTKLLANGLTEQAYIAANKITFTPAEKAGKAVAMLKMISYSFSIY
jgi:hypothetical protein